MYDHPIATTIYNLSRGTVSLPLEQIIRVNLRNFPRKTPNVAVRLFLNTERGKNIGDKGGQVRLG